MQGTVATAGRKRAAAELVAREDAELRRTARRFSLCEDDAEDAYQRALEILLLKAPSESPRELVRWMKTVVKHEALAVRRNRERLLGSARGEDGDPIERIASAGAGPGERLEVRERVARSREALLALKPAELRALTLLAAGYSYAEIGEITGFSRTKVNRCLAEGRERFRQVIGRSEDGSRCDELRPLLSAYCDGEASPHEEAAVREHLRACAGCRAAMRTYRAAPATVAALAPTLPVSRSLLDRAQELLAGLHSRLPGGGATDTGIAQVAAAGGTRGAGMAALAKALAICAGTVGGAACVATGVVPAPLGIEQPRTVEAKVERLSDRAMEAAAPTAIEYEPAPVTRQPEREPDATEAQPQPDPEPAPPAETAETGAVEYAPPPEQPTSAAVAEPSPSSAAGEFGP